MMMQKTVVIILKKTHEKGKINHQYYTTYQKTVQSKSVLIDPCSLQTHVVCLNMMVGETMTCP